MRICRNWCFHVYLSGFKSHDSKESVYRARKKTTGGVRIRPSLTKANKTLLYEAREALDEYKYKESNSDNLPAIFANIHGDIQAKFEKETKNGLYITLKSVEHLSLILAESGMDSNDEEKLDTWNFSD